MDDLGINNPLGLSPSEKPWYDAFVVTFKRQPECMWELMCWSANEQTAQKQFWGALGL